MSTYLNDRLKVGHGIKVMPPQGNFKVTPDHDQKRTHVFVAAGSGITPIISMIHSILEEEPMSKCLLLYGNRNRNTIIFKNTLDYLEELYKGQLMVEHTLSRPVLTRQSGISGFFKKPLIAWKGRIGRITPQLLEDCMQEHKIDRQQANYYICGPGMMIVEIDEHLKASIENHKQIHVEYFSTPEGVIIDDEKVVEATVIATLKGEVHKLDIPTGKSILDVMIDEKLDPPYSCTSGACSSCMAKVTKGTVMMDACYALDEDEIADGYILTCQAHPTDTEVAIDFDT
jgi:ring-1,2-phenylacetyl-CoA epoxidase subunit PaaE